MFGRRLLGKSGAKTTDITADDSLTCVYAMLKKETYLVGCVWHYVGHFISAVLHYRSRHMSLLSVTTQPL